MRTRRIKFNNKQDLELSARLELPAGSHEPGAYAIFAHCFSCGKNARAATSVSRELTQSGFGVLRFDFTGLGESEGDFGDTGFSNNISDLEAAADFLREFYVAPSLLIGHSLGGTAVIHAALRIQSVKAICTIGAPFEAEHLRHLLAVNPEDLDRGERVEVNLGGRNFRIGSGFYADLKSERTAKILPALKIPLLVMHAPGDKVVSIDNAREIYSAAFHPKSFISLDTADHLLLKPADATYAARMIGMWVSRYIDACKASGLETDQDVAVQIGSDKFTSEVIAGQHQFLADEPEKAGGNDLGPSPYQLLNAALGACTAMTLKMYADRKKWPLLKATIHLSHGKHYSADSSNPEKKSSKIDVFRRQIELEGDLDDKQRKRLLEIANKCPVHRTLTDNDVAIETQLKPE